MESTYPPIVAVHFASVTERNAYPVGLRRWGMIVTVYADSTSTNNKSYQLKYNQSSTNLGDNSNWVDASIGSVAIETKSRRDFSMITEHSGVVGASNSVVNANELDDGEAVTLTLTYSGKADSANTGIGGIFTTTWTKDGGALVKVADTDIVKVNNIGVALTVSSSESFGVISIALNLASGVAGNMSYSGWLERVFRKAS